MDLLANHPIHLLDGSVANQAQVFLPWAEEGLETHIYYLFHFEDGLSRIVSSHEIMKDDFCDLHDRDVGN